MISETDDNGLAARFALTRKEIELGKSAFLTEQLLSTRKRISELETREKLLEAQLRHLESKVQILAETAVHELSGDMIFAAERMQRTIKLLDLVQRRDAWLQVTSLLGLGGRVRSLYPHDGQPSRLSILVCGSGGFGDMLYLSMICRALWRRFDRPFIFVAHEHPDVLSVFDGNPFVVQALRLDGGSIRKLLETVSHLDVFDLIADVRYAVTFIEPSNSRIDYDFFLVAAGRSARYQVYTRGAWPFFNNDFAAEVSAKGLNKYSLALHTANLGAAVNECGDIWIEGDMDPAVAALLEKPYVTVHHGADRFMAGASGLQTKNLPDAHWAKVVRRLKSGGLSVVQIGENGEKAIEGVDVSLLGQLSFKGSADVLRFAQAHVDTEGGMVHAAAAVGTRSVVVFGPTPPAFFGYADNINIGTRECGDCWWTTRTWAQECPRGKVEPPCMSAHDPGAVAQAALSIAWRQLTLKPEGFRPLEGEGLLPALLAAAAAGAQQSGLVVVSDRASFSNLALLDHLRQTRARPRVALDISADMPDDWLAIEAFPAARNRVIAKAGECGWALIDQPDATAADMAGWIYELARGVGPNGRIFVAAEAAAAKTALAEMLAAVAALPGGRLVPVANPTGLPAARRSASRALIEFSVGEQPLSKAKGWSALSNSLFSREK